MRYLCSLSVIALSVTVIVPQIAEARGGFGGRMPRMNLGGGGMHNFGGFHGGGGGARFGGFNGSTHFQPRFHNNTGGGAISNIPHLQPPHGLQPAQHPISGPKPAPHPQPKPKPGPPPPPPHPGPPPHPYPPHPLPPPAPYWPGYWDPAGAAFWGAAAGVAIGTVISSLPSGCVSTVVNGINYEDCNGHWYERRYNGHSVVYVAVSSPR